MSEHDSNGPDLPPELMAKLEKLRANAAKRLDKLSRENPESLERLAMTVAIQSEADGMTPGELLGRAVANAIVSIFAPSHAEVARTRANAFLLSCFNRGLLEEIFVETAKDPKSGALQSAIDELASYTDLVEVDPDDEDNRIE